MTFVNTLDAALVLDIVNTMESDLAANYKGDERRISGCIRRARKMFDNGGFGPNVSQPIICMMCDAARVAAGKR